MRRDRERSLTPEPQAYRNGWPDQFEWDASAGPVLEQIDTAFALEQPPAEFADRNHCCECREHDDTLRAEPRERITREALGHGGWDPICFSSPEATAYLFPALARYAMAPPLWPQFDWYGEQLLFHLTSGGRYNRLHQSFTPPQHQAVAALLGWLLLHRTEDFDAGFLADDLAAGLNLWSANGT